jgi:hypothetical protein
MTLKIEKYADGNSTTIGLIGRMQAEHLEESKQIRENGPAITLVLDVVTLIDVEHKVGQKHAPISARRDRLPWRMKWEARIGQ